MRCSNIQTYMKTGARAHLVGIGGVSMAPLAEVLHGMGLTITGSDMSQSATVTKLNGLGIPVVIGHLPDSAIGADFVVRTAAVHDDNPEIAGAMAHGIPVFERAQAWGAIMEGYKNALCIAGTHGKTSTTSMCTHIAMAAQLDPTVMIGGALPLLGGAHRVGGGDTIILESCEYCNSYHSFRPTVAVILNVEADHLDYFKDLEDVEHSFATFAQLVPPEGAIVANGEDDSVARVLSKIKDRTILTFGLERGDVQPTALAWEAGIPSFDVSYRGEVYAHVTLQVPGRHNLLNALAACTAAIALKIPARAIEEGLASYYGVGRRFEYKGTCNGAKVYDDYAHHPTELKALLDATATMGYDRVICAFQPHTYTRTIALFDDFVQVLKQADYPVLTDIYAAREVNTTGISSKDLADVVSNCGYQPTLVDLVAHIKSIAKAGDLILTVGAGDIGTVGAMLVS